MKLLRNILCVTFAVLLCVVPFRASAVTVGDIELEDHFQTDGAWVYKTDKTDKTATIYAYLGSDLNAVIPEKIEGTYTVTEVCLSSDTEIEKGEGFQRFPIFTTNIQTLTIPKTIRSFWTHQHHSKYPADRTKVDILKHGDTVIMDGFFYDCNMKNLTAFIVDKENPYFSSKDGVLFNKDQSVLIRYPENKADESYEIPGTVTTIMDHAFAGTSPKVKEIIVPETVTEPGYWSTRGGYSTPDLRLPKFVIHNNAITEELWEQVFYDRYYGLIPKEVVVYKNSPAHKFLKKAIKDEIFGANEVKLTVIDNPDPSFAEQKTEAEKQTQADLVSPLTGDATAPLMPLAVLTMLCGFGLILFAKRRTT